MHKRIISNQASMTNGLLGLLVLCSSLGILLHSWTLGAIFGLPAISMASWKILKHRKQLTRWASRNPIQTRILITITQLALMFLGLLVGHNLYVLGVEIPTFAYWGFASMMLLGFVMVPFLQKNQGIILPSQLRKNRLFYATLGVSLLGIMAFSGNLLQKEYPNFFLTKAVLAVDQEMFPVIEDAHLQMEELEMDRWTITATSSVGNPAPISKRAMRKAMRAKRKMERKRARKAFLAMALAGEGGLIFFLTIATCMGVCIAGGGIALFFTAQVLGILGGVAALALGIIIARASVRAIRRAGPPPPSNF